MTKYQYTNSTPTWVTVDEKDIYLQAGNQYELPAENAYIRSLIDQGYLTPVEQKSFAKLKKSDK